MKFGIAAFISILLVNSDQTFLVSRSIGKITIDGNATESDWTKANWHPIDQVWIGEKPSHSDFKGKYKLLWDEKYLYVLAEIEDDTLTDTHPDGLDRYWDDDCLEIFIDENRSKGIHQYNHQAFAYHIGLDNRVADIGPDKKPHYYTEHAFSRHRTTGHTTIWETAILLFPDTYKDGVKNKPLILKPGKKIGFAIAYCDNDHSPERENFIGSEVVEATDKNRGWIDAGIFGEIRLK